MPRQGRDEPDQQGWARGSALSPDDLEELGTEPQSGADWAAAGSASPDDFDVEEVEDLRDRIAARAYQIWESEGQPQGRQEEHWRRAEQEIRREWRQSRERQE